MNHSGAKPPVPTMAVLSMLVMVSGAVLITSPELSAPIAAVAAVVAAAVAVMELMARHNK